MWGLYKTQPAFVLGFHGCDSRVGEKVLCNPGERIGKSNNRYDWLGSGVYFWEGSPQRAMEFAQEAAADERITRGKITTPFVVGAVIDLGRCLNLTDRSALEELANTYRVMEAGHRIEGLKMPVNKGSSRRLRFLDRAVIEFLHVLRDIAGLAPYDSVRAPFIEGDELYPNAGFHRQNHIQIAIRSPDCIKGYFRPIAQA